ncbi:MAG: prephenate dehydrogenase [Ruminococcus sp.]|nr:prephenate dehydrogenase [Ruminococcus sp.]
MKIGIVGLGLIGGSLAKAIKKNTPHSCFALDINKGTIAGAIAQEAIDGEIDTDGLSSCDVVIVSLHPIQTIDFILENKSKFKKGGIVIDTCGIKRKIVDSVEQALIGEGVDFLGCHPMAGREFSGFAYSVDNLFEKASFIMTPTDSTPMRVVKEISALAYNIGFAKVVVSNTEEHDSVIAFTSQLAHVVSSAYVKSPSLLKQSGFSAGSFKDLTRVAKLNEDMWTALFLMNKEPLVYEIDCIIARLTEYRDAIASDNKEVLHDLLRDGRELKELSNNQTR